MIRINLREKVSIKAMMDDILEVVEEDTDNIKPTEDLHFDEEAALSTELKVDCSADTSEIKHSEPIDIVKVTKSQDVGTDKKRSNDFEAMEEEIKIWRRKYKSTKENIEDEIRNVDSARTHAIKDIKRYKKELVSKLDELEKQSIESVNERCKHITDDMKALVGKIDNILSQIDRFKAENEANTSSTRMKKARYMREELSQIVSDVQGFEGVSIRLDKGIERCLNGLTGLAKVNFPCEPRLSRQVDIRFDSDVETCGISDICTLPDGTLVMTDLSNDCIKRLDLSYGKKDHLHLDGGPLGICATRLGEMAVTLREGKAVQFLNYTPAGMTLTNSFKTDCSCNYVGYMNDALFVTCEGDDADGGQGFIRKYDMTGNLLHTIETGDKGNSLFSTPLHITVNLDKTKLYVTDMDNKIIIIDDTRHLNRFRHIPLANAFGISALPNQNILVSSVETHTVYQFDDRGRFVGTVLRKTNGLVNPVCLAYNSFRNQVIVSMDDSDVLLVFDVSLQ